MNTNGSAVGNEELNTNGINTQEVLNQEFITAIENEDYDTLRKLIDTAESKYDLLNSTNNDENDTPLCAAVQCESRELVEFILNELRSSASETLNAIKASAPSASEASINKKSSRGKTALHHAAEIFDENTVDILLSVPGIDVNPVDDKGNTPIHYAADNEISLALLLEEKDIDVNAVNKDGNTALHLAAANKCAKCVEMLLAHPKINKNPINNEGYSPITIAIDSSGVMTNDFNSTESAKYKTIEKLIEMGCDVNKGTIIIDGKIKTKVNALDYANKFEQGLMVPISKTY